MRTITKFATEIDLEMVDLERPDLEMPDLEVEKHEDHLMPPIDSAQSRRDCM
jgi:hypothetical protein